MAAHIPAHLGRDNGFRRPATALADVAGWGFAAALCNALQFNSILIVILIGQGRNLPRAPFPLLATDFPTAILVENVKVSHIPTHAKVELGSFQ